MNLIKLIKKYFKQLIETATQKIESMNQAEFERLQAIETDRIKQSVFYFDNLLRRRWALALNSLPNSLRVSNTDISPDCLSNKFLSSYWEIEFPIAERLSTVKCKDITRSLKQILENQSNDCYQDFQRRFHEDYYEYSYQKSLDNEGSSRTISDDMFLNNYQRFINTHNFKLIDLMILNVYATDNTLVIQYAFNTDKCTHCDIDKYWNYITH